MGAFEKLQNYSAKRSSEVQAESVVSKFFDIKTPEGYFLNSLHKLGFAVVETVYEKGDVALTLSEYQSVENKDEYVPKERLTEFAEMLTAEGDLLTIASAGSGKTTALIFRIMRDILTGEATKPVSLLDGGTVRTVDSIFVGTFLKSGAEELKSKLAAWQRKMGYMVTSDRIQFGTLHAEFKRALNAMGVATPIGSAEVISNCLKTAITTAGIHRSDDRPLTFEDYKTIEGIVAFYRNRLDDQKYQHPAVEDYNLTPLFMDSLVSAFAKAREDAKIMDFEDLQELLYKYLYVTPNVAVQDFIANRYRYIYLDEFQDTSQIQYAILKFYARGRLAMNRDGSETGDAGLFTGTELKGKIIAIGDDDQSIYRWRGSDVDIITKEFPKDFRPTIVKLSVNYRCPSNILNPVKSSIVKNTDRYSKTLLSARDGGEFHAYHSTSIQGMIQHLVSQVEDDANNGRSVAIICRTNFDGVIPALMLEMSKKFTFSVSSDAMTLSSAMPRSIVNCARLITDRTSQYVTNTLKMIASRKDAFMVQDLVKRLKADASVGKSTSIWDIPQDDLLYSCSSIAMPILRMKKCIYDDKGMRVKGGEIDALKFLYSYLISSVFDGDSAYCLKMRSYIDAVLYLLNTENFVDAADFLNTMSEYNDMLTARVGKKNTKIKIVTVHEFKGKEADAVYVWHDSDKLFPASKTNIAITEDFEEERRVHYIACTRAREKCVIYALRGQHGIFFDELTTTVENLNALSKGTIRKVDTSSGEVGDELDSLFNLSSSVSVGKAQE